MGKIITGSMKKSFAAQSGVFSIYGDYLMTPTGSDYFFRLSVSQSDGGDTIFRFTEANKKIEDLYSLNLYGLNKNERVGFRIVSNTGYANFYINNILTSTTYESPSNTPYYDEVRVLASNGYADINLYISGQKPSYEFSGFSFSGTNPTGAGYIINKNPYLPFRLYSGVSDSGRFNISGSPLDITGTQQLKLVRNYTLSSDEELTTNTDPSNNFNFYSNFGIFSETVPVKTTFDIVQTLDYQRVLDFNGINSGSSFISWSNYKGTEIYEDGLPGELKFVYVTGNTGNMPISGIFRVKYGEQGAGTPAFNMDYISGISGFKLDLTTFTNSGINYLIERFNYSGNPITMKFSYSGYNTGFDYIFSGT